MRVIRRVFSKIPDVILLIVLFYFCLLPIVGVIGYGITANAGQLTKDSIVRILGLLANSLKLSGAVTLISVMLATAAAFTVYRLRFPGRRILWVLMLLPLVNPSFVGSLSFIMLFGTRGLITHKLLGLSISPFGWHGIMFLQVMGLTTIAYLIISGSIRSTNVDLEDAARNLGASEPYILTHITLPMMLPEITVAALLVFLASMADFSTPVVIGGNFHTLASDLYIQIIGVYDMKMASITGIVLLVPCFMAFVIQNKIANKKKFGHDGASGRNIVYGNCPRPIRAAMITLTLVQVCLFTLIFVFIFVGAFTKSWGYDYSFTLSHAAEVFSKGFRTYLKPLSNSVVLSLVTGVVTAALGTMLAYWVHQKKILSAKLVDIMCLLPAAVPGILFGIGYLVTFKHSLFGIGEYIFPSSPKIILLGTTVIIYLVCVARQMNLSMKSCYALLDHIDPDIMNASYNLGASKGYAAVRILIPMLKDAFMNAFLRIFSSTMSTLGAIVFLILPKNKVIIQILFQIISSNSMGTSCFIALLLSGTTLAVMLLFYTGAYGRNILYMYRRRGSV
ncbi:MAG: iron ABC transporter permease [Clostridiaceae bacterium]|nr:iron ABC transporter permease [Clostridiaceae bacterium]